MYNGISFLGTGNFTINQGYTLNASDTEINETCKIFFSDDF